MAERPVLTVSALNRYVHSLLAGDEHLADLRLCGEIANFVHHRSGHCYFTLRDERCSVQAVMFREEAQGLRFSPENGMSVVADARVTLYEEGGRYQVCVSHLFPQGQGSMRRAFEMLYARLKAQGLFAPEHRRPLPALPAVIGVITSDTGAALQDIRNVLARRYPIGRVLVWPVNVQGAQAAPDIAAAIRGFDALHLADVLIVARGGGSAEDLWVFNDEVIARAAYACTTPLISAIGHEIDYTILDYAADLRAPTPTAAAELVAPDIRSLRAQTGRCAQALRQALAARMEEESARLAAARRHEGLARAQSAAQRRAEHLRLQAAALQQAMRQYMQAHSQRLQHGRQLAATLAPEAVLRRGYAVLRQGGRAIDGAALQVGQTLTLETARRLLECRVQAITEKEEQP